MGFVGEEPLANGPSQPQRFRVGLQLPRYQNRGSVGTRLREAALGVSPKTLSGFQRHSWQSFPLGCSLVDWKLKQLQTLGDWKVTDAGFLPGGLGRTRLCKSLSREKRGVPLQAAQLL